MSKGVSLKAIAALVKEGAYEEAIEQVKQGLKADPNNYNLLVYGGAALTQTAAYDKAEQLYLRAKGLDGGNPAALQGLIELYTKREDKAKLAQSNHDLGIVGGLSVPKGRKYAIKAVAAYEEGKLYRECLDLLITVLVPNLSAEGPHDEEKNPTAATVRGWICRVAQLYVESSLSELSVSEVDHIMVEVKLAVQMGTEEAWDSSALNVMTNTYINLASRIYLRRNSAVELESAALYVLSFPSLSSNVSALNVILSTALCDGSTINIGNERSAAAHLALIVDQVMAQEGSNALAVMLKGVLLSADVKHKDESIALLKQGIKDVKDFERGAGWCALASIYIRSSGQSATALQCAAKALAAFQVKGANGYSLTALTIEASCIMARAHAHLNAVDKALQILDHLLVSHPCNLDLYKVKISIVGEELGDWKEALALCSTALSVCGFSPWVVSMKGWILFLDGDIAEACKVLESIAGISSKSPRDDFLLHYRMARVYWAMGDSYRLDRTKVFNNLLAAGKLDPEDANVFEYLGHYYIAIGDEERGKKCYSKALMLGPACEGAGVALADIYCANYQDSLAALIYENALKLDVKALWAWERQARYLLLKERYDDSITPFHGALRMKPHSDVLWIGLATAYYKSGKFSSALKAAAKSVELNPSSMEGYTLVGQVNRALKVYEDALIAFLKAVEIDGSNVIANKGVAETLLDVAFKDIQEGRYGAATCKLIEGAEAAEATARLVGNSVSVLKLMGDIYSTASQVSPLSFSPRLEEGRHLQLHFVAKGARAYSKAVHLDPSIASSWYDLGANRYQQASTLYRGGGGGSGLPMSGDVQKTVQLLNGEAEHIFHVALLANPLDPLFWNALGVVSHVPLKQQHCFIRSVQLDNNSTAWNNLGLFYLEQGQTRLAQEALLTSQCLNPASGTMWYGNGLVKEYRAKCREDFDAVHAAYSCSMDARPPLAAKLAAGYAALKTGNLKDAENALVSYTQSFQMNPLAYCLLALTHEALHQWGPALAAFDKASSLLLSGYTKEGAVGQLDDMITNGRRRTESKSNVPSNASVMDSVLSAKWDTAMANLSTGSDPALGVTDIIGTITTLLSDLRIVDDQYSRDHDITIANAALAAATNIITPNIVTEESVPNLVIQIGEASLAPPSDAGAKTEYNDRQKHCAAAAKLVHLNPSLVSSWKCLKYTVTLYDSKSL